MISLPRGMARRMLKDEPLQLIFCTMTLIMRRIESVKLLKSLHIFDMCKGVRARNP